MKSIKTQYMVKALLHRFHEDEKLLRFFPEETAQSIKKKENVSSVDFSSVLCIRKWLLPIHYSWFYAPLKELPEKSLPCFLPLFSAEQARKLCDLLQLSPPEQRPGHFTELYLSFYLKKIIQPTSILPQELIPKSSMNVLLNISQKHLLTLVDFLGLFDLAADLKQVVDKKLMTKIRAALSPEQNLFLQDCSKRPSKWTPPKLGLLGWNGDPKTLNSLLHGRGLIRLAKAIAREETSYRWYLVHRFDTSRGSIMQKELKNPADPHLIPFFKGQVFDIVKRFK